MTETLNSISPKTVYFAVVDGVLAPASEAVVPALDLGLIRGDGVFEVFQVYNGLPFALDEHLARLKRSADGLAMSFSEDLLRDDLKLLKDAVPQHNGNIRVVVTRSGTRIILQEPEIIAPHRYRLELVPHSVHPLLAGVKSLSYAANCHARRIAERAGCDDALLFSESDGQVYEGPFTSFAWVENGQIYTPPLAIGILDSITRRVLIESTGALERICLRKDLAHAEGACVLGTGIEVRPVIEIRNVCTFPSVVPEIQRAMSAVSALIQSRLNKT